MISSIVKFLTDVIQNTVIAVSTSVVTVTTGTATWLDWIPIDIGKLASLIGLVLSIVLIVGALIKRRQNTEMHNSTMKKNVLEMKLLEARLRSFIK